tara:strand:- start:41 stop:373 length:333 start_codon:yes stop_codon:yes gene_type:complete
LQVAVSRVRNGNFRWLLEYEARMTLRPSDCAGGAALSFQFSAAPISFMGSLVRQPWPTRAPTLALRSTLQLLRAARRLLHAARAGGIVRAGSESPVAPSRRSGIPSAIFS